MSPRGDCTQRGRGQEKEPVPVALPHCSCSRTPGSWARRAWTCLGCSVCWTVGQNRPGSLKEVGEEVSWAHEEREAGDMLAELTPAP